MRFRLAIQRRQIVKSVKRVHYECFFFFTKYMEFDMSIFL